MITIPEWLVWLLVPAIFFAGMIADIGLWLITRKEYERKRN